MVLATTRLGVCIKREHKPAGSTSAGLAIRVACQSKRQTYPTLNFKQEQLSNYRKTGACRLTINKNIRAYYWPLKNMNAIITRSFKCVSSDIKEPS